MKVIAFFNLKENTHIKQFNDWVVRRHTTVFAEYFPKMQNFKVRRLTDSDNYAPLPQIVQTFDWSGTEQDWRDTMEQMRSSGDDELRAVVNEWLEFCDDSSTQIIYAEDI